MFGLDAVNLLSRGRDGGPAGGDSGVAAAPKPTNGCCLAGIGGGGRGSGKRRLVRRHATGGL